MSNCMNCGEDITANFCSNCGQKKFKRIDRKYIVDELQYSFIHTNKGFFYSVKNIIKNPGKTAKDFIDGNRVNHYKPILLAFLLSTISAFISYKIVGFREIMDNYYVEKSANASINNDIQSKIASYNAIIMLLMIPVYALFSKIVFRKWGNNYYEHIVMNSYILSFYTIAMICLIYPVMYIFHDNTDVITACMILGFVSIPLIMVWFFKSFYPEKPLGTIILRVFLHIVLVCAFVMFLIMLLSFLYVFYLAAVNPELLKEFQKK